MTLDEAIRYCSEWNARIEFGHVPRTGEPMVGVYLSRPTTEWGKGRDHVQLLIDLVTRLKTDAEGQDT